MDNTLQRLTRMSDLIFASAMTILILLLQFPTAEQIDSSDAFELYLDESLPRLYLFMVTFLIVAIYWVKDLEQFKYVIKTNNRHIWFQLGSLVFLILLPWVNSLLEIKPENINVRIIFCIDIFFIGFFSSMAWHYASKNHRLIKTETDHLLINEIRSSNFAEPIVALVAIIAALFLPSLFNLTFILIPILFIIQKKIRTRLKIKLRSKKK
jgi:uncharacterized membrane protein